MARNRRIVLGSLLAFFLALSALALADVFATVFFTVTVAYVLYPLRTAAVRRGLSPRAAAAAATGVAFVSLIALVAPVAFVVYRRRLALFDLFRRLPAQITLAYGEFSYVVETAPLLEDAREFVTALALAVAGETPVLALKVLLFAFLLYGLLYHPRAVGAAAMEIVPPAYHDVVRALHRRVRETLLALYVLQAATAAGTFTVAFVVFSLLGYDAAFSLAVVSAVLQFIPVLGPSLVVGALVVVDVVAGETLRAVVTLVFGLVFVGFLPDAVIRPRLAEYASDLPVSLYFVGFVGGVLTLGVAGFIAGPLVVALLLEVVTLVTAENDNGAAVDERAGTNAAPVAGTDTSPQSIDPADEGSETGHPESRSDRSR